eukprot:961963-Amphidinium_carterae.1
MRQLDNRANSSSNITHALGTTFVPRFLTTPLQDLGIDWSSAGFQVQLGVRAFSVLDRLRTYRDPVSDQCRKERSSVEIAGLIVQESCEYLLFDAVFLMLLFLYLDQAECNPMNPSDCSHEV